jgi:hypothetical protein
MPLEALRRHLRGWWVDFNNPFCILDLNRKSKKKSGGGTIFIFGRGVNCT